MGSHSIPADLPDGRQKPREHRAHSPAALGDSVERTTAQGASNSPAGGGQYVLSEDASNRKKAHFFPTSIRDKVDQEREKLGLSCSCSNGLYIKCHQRYVQHSLWRTKLKKTPREMREHHNTITAG